MVLLRLSGSCRSASCDASSSSGSGYSAALLTCVGRNVPLSHRTIGESTQVSSGHSLYNCPGMSFQCSASPNTNEKHASRHLGTLHAPEAPCEMYLPTRVFSSVCQSTSGVPFTTFDSDHLFVVQGFAIWIIRCAASSRASWSPVRMACIKLFTAEYSASAPCISITVSFSGFSGSPYNSSIV